MYFSKKKLMTVLGAVLLSGCATIIHGGSTQRVGISSSPTGARVSVDGSMVGMTPMFADLKRGNEHIVTLTLEGYQPAQLTLTKTVSGWIWGNILIGGLIGLVVDFASGSVYNLNPDQLSATLQKQGVSVLQPEGSLYVLTTLHADPSWHKLAQLTPAGAPLN